MITKNSKYFYFYSTAFNVFMNIWYILYWIHHWNQIIKIWCTVILAGERYMSVAYPFKIITLSSKKNSIITITILVILSGLVTMPRLFEFQKKERPPVEIYTSTSNRYMINQCMESEPNITMLENYIRPSGINCTIFCSCISQWEKEPTNKFWFHIVFEMSIKFTLPFILLLIFNVGLIRNLYKTYKFRSKLTKSKQKKFLKRQESAISSTQDNGNNWNAFYPIVYFTPIKFYLTIFDAPLFPPLFSILGQISKEENSKKSSTNPSTRLWFVNISSLAIVLSFSLCRWDLKLAPTGKSD